MGTKYTIEVEDKPFELLSEDGFTSEKLYRVKGFNSLVFDWNGLNMLTPYTEPDLEQIKRDYDDWYEKGLNDAWEAARKIWKYDTTTLRAIFGEGIMRMDWFMKFTASEAIEKIRQYEQEKEGKLGIREYFKNGEEVIDADGTKAVILHVSEDNYCQVYTEKGCIENWHIHTYKFHKTGRHFPEIAEVMQKMKEEQKQK